MSEKIEIYEPVISEANFSMNLGVFTQRIDDSLREDFRGSTDIDDRVGKIKETAIKIYNSAFNILKLGQNHNLLTVGKVQSGKTSNLEYLTGIAFDNGYNTMILYGGYDKILTGQAFDRFKKAFKCTSDDEEIDNVSIIGTVDSNELDGITSELLEDSYFANNGRVIICCMKKKEHLKRVNDFLEKVNRQLIKSFIIDDEGDQASLNTMYKKNEKSATYNEIIKMKELLSYPLYISVTATPQALIFTPDQSELRPKDVALIYPGNGYDGCEKFHINKDHIISVPEDDNKILLNQHKGLPKSLMSAIHYYIISSAIMLKRGIKKSQMIVHVAKEIVNHTTIFTKIQNYIRPRSITARNDIKTDFEYFLKVIGTIYNNEYFSDDILKTFKFDDLKEEIRNVLSRIFIIKQDSDGFDTMSNIDRQRYQIRVGAQLLERGVTFKELVVTYFTRWPSTTGNMDTSMQRARWLGYRGKFFDLCKVFCTEKIAFKFAKLTDIETDLWDQLEQVVEKRLSFDDILIDCGENDIGLRPSRGNVISYKKLKFGRNWLNQRQAFPKIIAEKNNKVLDDIIVEKTIYESSVGRTDGKVSCWCIDITSNEFKKLLTETNGIFVDKPFANILNLLGSTKYNKITLQLFWNPNSLVKNLRRRTYFYDSDSNTVLISALQQGSSKVDKTESNYLGDANVITDKESILIEVSRVAPLEKSVGIDLNSYEFPQYMYSIHFPRMRVVYEREAD